MTSTPDPAVAGADEIALAALVEVTPRSTIGARVGDRVENDGAVSLLFENTLPGYPGWLWTITLSRVEGSAPTVLEVELLPGYGALLAPDWVPWAERLAEYRAQQLSAAEGLDDVVPSDSSDDTDLHDDLDDEDDMDDEEETVDAEFDVRTLHAGDLDGVDIDELDDVGQFDDLGEITGVDTDDNSNRLAVSEDE